MKQGIRVLKELVKDEIETGKIELREIEGLTIENRVAKLESLPEDVLEEVKKCNVLLKGPMTTPRAGDGLPNLYGDIVTDVAAEHAGGLGTACSSNIGNQYALFEAIHGTAPYLMSHGRGEYANPCSLIRAVGQMLIHIGYADRNQILEEALDICTVTEKKLVVTTETKDANAAEFTDYLLDTIRNLKNKM